MAAFDLTSADPMMKIAFAPRIVKQFNSAAVFYNRRAEGKGIPISNRGFEIPVHTGPNADFAWYSDGGTMPAGSGEVLNRASVGFFSFSQAIQFTGAALDAAGDDAVTYSRALAFNVRNATVNALKYLNIYSFGDGTGILAKSGGSVTPSTTVNWTFDASGLGDGERFLRPGMTLDFLTGTTTPVKVSAPIVSIAAPIAFPGGSAPINVTMGPATGTTALASGDGAVVSGSLSKVLAGLQLLVDDGTVSSVLQNVNRSLVPQYKPTNVVLSGTPALSRDHLRRAIANIQIARGSVNPGNLEIWSHPSQLHAYADMGWPLKRFMDASSKKLDLGYTAYEFEGMPWIIDTDAPRDRIFFVDNDSIFKVTARELSFDDRTGSILRQVPSATANRYDDKFVAFLLFRGNLGVYSPNSNVQVNGLAVPSGY